MILHSVYFSFRPEIGEEQRDALLNELGTFSLTLDGVTAFETGWNRDFEQKSSAYRNGFVIRFRDEAAVGVYASHPTHQRLGDELCQAVIGGADGIIVFDLDISDR